MKHEPSNPQNRPVEELGQPNDDGNVLGTAGRDEAPNAATDWDHPGTVRKPGEADVLPPNGTPDIDSVPACDNEHAD